MHFVGHVDVKFRWYKCNTVGHITVILCKPCQCRMLSHLDVCHFVGHICVRKVLKYQRYNQKTLFEGKTIQWQKEKAQKDKLYYTENQVLSNTNPTKNRGKSLQIVRHMSVDLLP